MALGGLGRDLTLLCKTLETSQNYSRKFSRGCAITDCRLVNFFSLERPRALCRVWGVPGSRPPGPEPPHPRGSSEDETANPKGGVAPFGGV